MPRKKSTPAEGSNNLDKGSDTLSATAPSVNLQSESTRAGAASRPAEPKKAPARTRSSQPPSLAASAASETAPYKETVPTDGGTETARSNGTDPRTDQARMKTSKGSSSRKAQEPYDVGSDAVQEANAELERTSLELRAWEIWMSEGCPEGRALDHWLQAERERN